jgi:hypothetical protein
MVEALVRLALRHYRDPTSWAGVVSGVLVSANVAVRPDVVTNIDVILGAIVSLALVLMDGRRNPNTDHTGAISVRPAADQPPAVPPAAGSAASPVQDSSGPGVPAPTAQFHPQPNRPGFGPY